MPKPVGRPPKARIAEPAPVGRPKVKHCAYADCGHTVAKDARYCPRHCAHVLTELRASREYRTDDLGRGPQGQIAPAYERTKTSEL
jgi:hypothetical protein